MPVSRDLTGGEGLSISRTVLAGSVITPGSAYSSWAFMDI